MADNNVTDPTAMTVGSMAYSAEQMEEAAKLTGRASAMLDAVACGQTPSTEAAREAATELRGMSMGLHDAAMREQESGARSAAILALGTLSRFVHNAHAAAGAIPVLFDREADETFPAEPAIRALATGLVHTETPASIAGGALDAIDKLSELLGVTDCEHQFREELEALRERRYAALMEGSHHG